MKICLVSQEVGGVRGGGIGTYVTEAGKAFRQAGHETFLLTRGGREMPPEIEGFDHVSLVDPVAATREPPTFDRGGSHYAHAHRVHRALRELDVDLDYIEFPDYQAEGLVALQEQRCFGTYGSTLMAVNLHTPTNEILHLDDQWHRADLAWRELCSMEDEAIRIAPQIHSPSLALASMVRERLTLGREIEIVPYPMVFAAAPPPPSSGRALDALSFLYFGRIEPRKGVEELIEAFRLLPELRLHLVGGDTPWSRSGTSFRAELEANRPENVEFLGPRDRQELLSLLPRYEVCILPSRFDNWPNVCLEAMGAARVVMGSHRGGMAEMIDDGVHGFLVDGESPTDIVRVVREVLPRHLDRLHEIGRAAGERARELSSPDRFVSRIETLVEESKSAWRPESPADAAKVSIVIPFEGIAADTEALWGSLQASDHVAVELIAVATPAGVESARALHDTATGAGRTCHLLISESEDSSRLRSRAVRAATGRYLLMLGGPGDLLVPEAVAWATESLERNPDSAFARGQRLRSVAGSGSTRADNPLPFDRSTALLNPNFGGGGIMYRRALFEKGLAYDERLPLGQELALHLDLDRLDLHGECLPRVLLRSLSSRPSPSEEVRSLAHFPAAMALLIERHGPGSDPSGREALMAVFATAGVAISGTIGESPVELGDTLSKVARRAPRLSLALFRVSGWAHRVWLRLRS